MRVLSVAFPDLPVGTPISGGAEHILSILESGLVDRGHHSMVVAAKGSRIAGDLIETPAGLPSHEARREAIRHAFTRYQIDLVHFHGVDFHQYVPDENQPMLATLHLPLSFYPEPALADSRLQLNCVSHSQAASSPQSRSWPVIPNGIRTSDYAPAPSETYLLWLGRICPEKGVHLALDVAQRLQARLIIAGPVHAYPDHQRYFTDCILPRLDSLRTYTGPVDSAQKRTLLARAHCLLIPSLVAETSSLVAMEALSSGTPVIAFRTGALPEIIEDGATGFLVDSPQEMAEAVGQLSRISRRHCRDCAVRRFDAARMIDDYLGLYRRMITRRLGTAVAPQENL